MFHHNRFSSSIEMLSWFSFIFLSTFLGMSNTQMAGPQNVVPTPFRTIAQNNVRFYLFPDNSRPSLQREIVYGNAESLRKAGIIPNENIQIYTHGFSHNYTTGGCIPLKNAFYKRKYKNFICVDWGKLAAHNIDTLLSSSAVVNVFYPEAVKATAIVGKRLAEFLIFLKAQNAIDTYERIHLIGLSLGAHISGTAGFHFKQKTNTSLKRITGLDPAGPLYEMGLVPNRFKLDKTKADFVDVLHTDAGNLGTVELAGDVDFFANGGRSVDQEFCTKSANSSNPLDVFGCAHALSVDYYERAILGEKLKGCPWTFVAKAAPVKQPCPKPPKCHPTTKYGFHLPKASYGNYYLPVPLKPPPSIAADYEQHKKFS